MLSTLSLLSWESSSPTLPYHLTVAVCSLQIQYLIFNTVILSLVSAWLTWNQRIGSDTINSGLALLLLYTWFNNPHSSLRPSRDEMNVCIDRHQTDWVTRPLWCKCEEIKEKCSASLGVANTRLSVPAQAQQRRPVVKEVLPHSHAVRQICLKEGLSSSTHSSQFTEISFYNSPQQLWPAFSPRLEIFLDFEPGADLGQVTSHVGVRIDDFRGLILINWETLEKVCIDMMLLW